MSDDRSMLERLLAGKEYIAQGDELFEMSRRGQDMMATYNATTARQGDLRRKLLEEWLGGIGEGSEIRPPFYVDFGSRITIGAGCFLNFNVVALDVAPITLGDAVLIGPNVQLLTPTHPLDPARRRKGWEGGEPITINDNVWIGGGAIICPGVTIGENSVIGAGAVVTKDIPANVVAVGNPARVIKQLSDES